MTLSDDLCILVKHLFDRNKMSSSVGKKRVA
jgi:hypothetical protein